MTEYSGYLYFMAVWLWCEGGVLVKSRAQEVAVAECLINDPVIFREIMRIQQKINGVGGGFSN